MAWLSWSGSGCSEWDGDEEDMVDMGGGRIGVVCRWRRTVVRGGVRRWWREREVVCDESAVASYWRCL